MEIRDRGNVQATHRLHRVGRFLLAEVIFANKCLNPEKRGRNVAACVLHTCWHHMTPRFCDALSVPWAWTRQQITYLVLPVSCKKTFKFLICDCDKAQSEVLAKFVGHLGGDICQSLFQSAQSTHATNQNQRTEFSCHDHHGLTANGTVASCLLSLLVQLVSLFFFYVFLRFSHRSE